MGGWRKVRYLSLNLDINECTNMDNKIQSVFSLKWKQRKQTENRYRKVCFPGSPSYTREKPLGKQRKHFFKVNYRNIHIFLFLYLYKEVKKLVFLFSLSVFLSYRGRIRETAFVFRRHFLFSFCFLYHLYWSWCKKKRNHFYEYWKEQISLVTPRKAST